MSIDTLAQIATAVATSVLVPSVIWLVKAILRLNETMTRLETKISAGIEPDVEQCKVDIGILYDRTDEQGKTLAALKATHPGLSQ